MPSWVTSGIRPRHSGDTPGKSARKIKLRKWKLTEEHRYREQRRGHRRHDQVGVEPGGLEGSRSGACPVGYHQASDHGEDVTRRPGRGEALGSHHSFQPWEAGVQRDAHSHSTATAQPHPFATHT